MTYDSKGRRYYYNNEGDSRWSHPSLPKGWSEATDIETQRTYYFHRSGAPSQWSFPEGASAIYDRTIEQDNNETANITTTTTTTTTSSSSSALAFTEDDPKRVYHDDPIIDAYLSNVSESRCRKTCYKDQCDGSVMGAIPRGQTWLMKRKSVTEKGCCFLLLKACDLCCEPPTQNELKHLRGSIVITGEKEAVAAVPPPPELEEIGVFPGRPQADEVVLSLEEFSKCPEGCLTCDDVSRGGFECLSCEPDFKLIRFKGKRGRCIARVPRIQSSSSEESSLSSSSRSSGNSSSDCGKCSAIPGACDIDCPENCVCCVENDCVKCMPGYYLDPERQCLHSGLNIEESEDIRSISCTTGDATGKGNDAYVK